MVSNYTLIRPILTGMPKFIKSRSFTGMITMAMYASVMPWTSFIPPFYGIFSFIFMFFWNYRSDPFGFVYRYKKDDEETDGNGSYLIRSLIITFLTNWIPLFFIYLFLLLFVNLKLY
jgi:hypothetical protein